MDCSLPVEVGNWSRVYMDGSYHHFGIFRHVPTNFLVCPDDLYFKHHAERVFSNLDLKGLASDLNALRSLAAQVNQAIYS